MSKIDKIKRRDEQLDRVRRGDWSTVPQACKDRRLLLRILVVLLKKLVQATDEQQLAKTDICPLPLDEDCPTSEPDEVGNSRVLGCDECWLAWAEAQIEEDSDA